MKSRKSLIQRCYFKVNDRRQAVADIETMIETFNQKVIDLEGQIKHEQEKSGVDDVNHFTYPTFAKAAIQRRDNLKNSIAELELKLVEARDHLSEACEEFKKIELIEEKPQPDRRPITGRIQRDRPHAEYSY